MRVSDSIINLDTISKATMFRILAMTLVIGFILAGCVAILSPFFPAILLAIIFTLSTWPAFKWLEVKLGHRTALASILMTVFLAVGFLVPMILIANSLTGNFSKLWSLITTGLAQNDGTPPSWIEELPFVSEYALAFWDKYLADSQTLHQTLSQNAGKISQTILAIATSIGRGVVDLSLGVFITYFLFRHGVQVAERLSELTEKFVGPYGQNLLIVSKNTMIGVLYGIVGTAIAQGTLAAIGFSIAGIPGAVFLGLMTFFMSFVPMGPPFIWVPATLYLLSEHQIGMGIFLFFWGLLVISMADNVIRPLFVSLGSNLPLLLVLLGILGGILAFGFIGLFIGPTLLALAYTLIIAWTNKQAVIAEAQAEQLEIPVE